MARKKDANQYCKLSGLMPTFSFSYVVAVVVVVCGSVRGVWESHPRLGESQLKTPYVHAYCVLSWDAVAELGLSSLKGGNYTFFIFLSTIALVSFILVVIICVVLVILLRVPLWK